MYIHRAGTFVQSVQEPRASLKDALREAGGVPLRRAGRFNQLAVVGARRCCVGMTLPADCDVILSSINGSLSDTATVLDDLLVARQMPMPFDFINTQNNSGCFYVASELGLSGSSLFCSHHEHPLEAALELALVRWSGADANAMLTGYVEEWTAPRYTHPSGQDAESPSVREGACWFLSGGRDLTTAPLAHVLELRLALSRAQLVELLQQHGLASRTVHWDVDAACAEFVLAVAQASRQICGKTTPLEDAAALAGLLNTPISAPLCRLRADSDGRYRLLLLDVARAGGCVR